jgi:hypothetical protein
VFWTAVALYLLSFLLPVNLAFTGGAPNSAYGFYLFTAVFVMPLYHLPFPKPLVYAVWLANPIFWVGAFCGPYDRPRLRLVTGTVGLMLAALFQIVYFRTPLLEPAFIVWLTSMTLLALSGWLTGSAGRRTGESL